MTQYATIFDMDGVLFDSGPHHLKSWQAFSDQHGLAFNAEIFYQTLGMRNDEIIPLLYPGDPLGKDYQKINEDKEAIYREIVKGKVEAPQGLLSFVQSLKNNGFKMAVGSSGPKANVELIVQELGLKDQIVHLVSGDDVTRGKPDPEIFLKAAQFCGCDPRACVVVEDAVVGIQAAKKAGMVAVGITTTATREALAQADLVIDSFTELTAQQVQVLLEKNI